MRKNWKKRLAIGLVGLSGLASLGSCSSFFGTDSASSDVISISSITYSDLEDGTRVIIITLSDGSVSKVPVPKGADGNDGLGIENITAVKSEDGSSTTITITFTDGRDPVTYEVTNARSIVNVSSEVDEETGVTKVTLTYNDGTTDTVNLPQGKTGKGISSMEIIEQDGTQYVQVTYDDETTVQLYAVPEGTPGRGIAGIVQSFDEETGEWVFTITYDDDEQTTHEFRIQGPNTWLSGTGTPANNVGYNGDYYLDTQNRSIYKKENGQWSLVINFNDTVERTKYTVTFDSNGGSLSTTTNSYELIEGSNFMSSGFDVPTATRDGYAFDGWYSKKNVDASTMTAFGDGTNVYSNLTLYAHWVQNHTVNFVVDSSARESLTGDSSFSLKDGYSFYASSYSLPTASKDGYTFTGWYTKKDDDPNLDKFGNLTPVHSDMTLYPHWSQN